MYYYFYLNTVKVLEKFDYLIVILHFPNRKMERFMEGNHSQKKKKNSHEKSLLDVYIHNHSPEIL